MVYDFEGTLLHLYLQQRRPAVRASTREKRKVHELPRARYQPHAQLREEAIWLSSGWKIQAFEREHRAQV